MVNMNYTETRTDELQCTEDKNIKVDTPSYYDGKNNYTAIDVVNNFDLNYTLLSFSISWTKSLTSVSLLIRSFALLYPCIIVE